MAPSRNRVVTLVGAGDGDGHGNGHGNGNGAGVGGLAIGTGYESPSEDNVPSFLEPPPPPSPGLAVPPSSVLPSAAPRPLLVQRSSYVAVAVTTSGPSPDHGRHGHAVSRGSSLNHVIAAVEKTPGSRKVGIRDRIACHQWTYFTMTMSTGGIANIMHSLKWHTSWIRGIGVFFFMLNVALFITNCVLLVMRFRLRPGTFIRSFTDQVESLFIPSFFVSITVILINVCQYGIPHCGPWLVHTMEVVFWVHGAISVCASAGLYLILWSTLIFPVHTMTPTWVFPAYPLLLNAPFAGNLISAAQKSEYPLSLNPTAMAFGAATLQGTGCLIAFMISAAFIYRLMTQKLPRDAQRPGIFMSIGPYGFTAAGIAQLGSQAEHIIPETFIGTPNIAPIIKVVSILVSLWLWGLAMWFFIVCVGALWKYLRTGSSIPFQVTWWSFVFPNTALITATGIMGDVFESDGLHIFACVMTIAITIVWVIIFTKMIWALKTRKLLWPKNKI